MTAAINLMGVSKTYEFLTYSMASSGFVVTLPAKQNIRVNHDLKKSINVESAH